MSLLEKDEDALRKDGVLGRFQTKGILPGVDGIPSPLPSLEKGEPSSVGFGSGVEEVGFGD